MGNFKHYIELTKPRIGLLVIITAYLGYYIGLRKIDLYMVQSTEWVVLLHLLFGMFLSCSGACVFNQYFERSIDAKMDRTKNRPLPLGKIEPIRAYLFGMFLFLLSTFYLYFFINTTVAVLSCLTYITYLFVYTPLKQITTLNTLFGSIPGAIPPVGGWVAATGNIESPAWILFGVLVCWQIPHFLAIAIIYSEDYSKGGLKMLPSVYPDNKLTHAHILFFTIALTFVSLGLYVIKYAGIVYAVGAVLLGLVFMYYSIQMIKDSSIQNAKRLFYYSIAYLPILIFLIILS
jgi:protoheme IX farnesyltransferase